MFSIFWPHKYIQQQPTEIWIIRIITCWSVHSITIAMFGYETWSRECSRCEGSSLVDDCLLNYMYVLRHVFEWDGIETSISPSFYETRPVRSTNAHLHKNMASQDDTTNDRDDVTEANQEKELLPSASLSSRLRMIKTISMFLIYMGLVWTFLATN